MKIKVADLEPNPFRDFDSYPIDRERVDGLKDSIEKDEYWGGIPVRPHPTKKGKYQIGCGHHRLVCLQESKVEMIEARVVPYDKLGMIRVMTNENAQYADRPKLVNADIERVKIALDEELAKYNKLSDMPDLKYFSGLKTENEFASLKNRGVGRGTILTYLGKTWVKKSWMIQAALVTLKDEKAGTLDRKSLETIPTIDAANKFRQAVKTYDIPKPTQKKIAKKIVKEKVPSKDIPALVAEHSIFPIPNLKKKKTLKPRIIPNVVEFVFKCENDTDSLNHRLRELCPEVAEIANKGRLLGRLVPGLKRLNKTILDVVKKYEGIQIGKGKDKAKKVASVQVLD